MAAPRTVAVMSKERWELEAERLVDQLRRVVDQRNSLKIQLADTEYALADAMAYVDELQAVMAVMDAELWRLRSAKPDRRKIAMLAGVVGLVVGSLVTGVGEGVGSELYRDLRGLEKQATAVVVYCDGQTGGTSNLTVTSAEENAAARPAHVLVQAETVQGRTDIPTPALSSELPDSGPARGERPTHPSVTGGADIPPGPGPAEPSGGAVIP